MQKIDDLFNINFIIDSFANFTFNIRSTTLFNSIMLSTIINLVIFYIISINKLFLLYLGNINKLVVFFNNITNWLLQTNLVDFVVYIYNNNFLIWYIPIYLLIFKLLNINSFH